MTKLVWVGIIVDLILVSHAKPARLNVDLFDNIKSPKANQAPLDGSSNRGMGDWLCKKTCKINPLQNCDSCESPGSSSSSEEPVRPLTKFTTEPGIVMTGLA